MNQEVEAIPEGHHSLTPYLIVKDASRAIEFYKKAFDAQEIYRMEGENHKVGHCELLIGDSRIMMADEFPDMNAIAPSGKDRSFSLVLYIKNVDEVFKRAIDAGAKVIRPLENKFYGDRMGTLIDPFGHTWSLGSHIEDVTPEEMEKRMKEMKH